MPLIRPHTLAVLTLAAIASWDTTPSANAASTPQPVSPAPAKDVVVPVATVAPRAIAPISAPETLVAQQFSSGATSPSTRPPETAQYYQDYQSVPVPTATAPSTQTTAQNSSSPTQSSQATSLSDPVWVVPTSPSAAPQSAAPLVTVPGVGSPAPSPRSTTPNSTPPQTTNPSGTASSAPDLAVTATDVQVVGGDAELQQLVRNTIRTQPGGETSQRQLQQDVANLLDSGFFANASVSSRPNAQGLSVTFQVEPIVVRSLRLSGAQALTLDVANQIFQPQLGTTVSPSALTQGVKGINDWYAKNGYTLARVLTLDPNRDGVVTITVAEGVVGDIQLRFLNKDGKAVDDKGQPIRPRTQEGLIRSQIKLPQGQPFREDLARQDLKRLAQLGVFQNANVTFEGDAQRTTVVYNLVEAPSRGFNFGGGYNDDLGIFGTISYQDSNFGGLGQRLSSNVQVGSRDVQFDTRFVSPYRDTDPNTPGYGADFFRRQGLSRVFDDKIPLANGQDVRERRTGLGVNLDRPLGPTWNGSLGLNYTNVSLRDREGNVEKVDAKGNPLSFSGTGIDDLTTLSFTATRDLRDNTVNPGNGSVLSLSTEQTLPIGRGEILGNRLQANYAQYIPVSLIKTDNAQQPQVLAFNVQGGTTIGDLPPYNAFVLGGINSVRGYDTGDVASSRSYLQLSAEYRFPIYKFIGGVAFADYASDLGSSDSVLGEPGVQRGKPGSGFGYGLGLRVNSPLGIIRADFGINDQGDSRLQFGFGQRF